MLDFPDLVARAGPDRDMGADTGSAAPNEIVRRAACVRCLSKEGLLLRGWLKPIDV